MPDAGTTEPSAAPAPRRPRRGLGHALAIMLVVTVSPPTPADLVAGYLPGPPTPSRGTVSGDVGVAVVVPPPTRPSAH